ncbi:MAG: SDR family oxidoreductase [Candidatus Cyclobacteriaceae bacterium M2_1C_046]
MEKVLVAGANGNTGTRIVKILKNHGQYDPIAMIRNEDQKEKFDSLEVEVKLADLEADLSGVLDDIDKVIFAAGSGSHTGKDKTTEVDEKGAVKLINEAKKVNLKKFVMLSAMGADDPENHPKLEHYLKAKHNADEHLKESGLNYSIIRPGGLTNEDQKGKIKAANKLNDRGQISREDVAHVIVSALDHTNTHNQVIEILEGEESLQEALAKIQ